MNTDAIVAGMLRDAHAQRFLLRCKATGDNKVRTADDVLGERITRLAAMVVTADKRPGHMIMRQATTTQVETMKLIARAALLATPYLWTEEVRMGLRGLEVPRHVLSPRVLPQSMSWHTFETGIALGGTLEHNGRKFKGDTADAMLVVDRGTGMEIVQFGAMEDEETGEECPAVTGGILKYGSVYPDDFEGDWKNLATGVLMMLAFLASPFIPKQQMRGSRAARRENQRLGVPETPEDLVTFVILRRPENRRHPSDDPPSTVEWKHRWLVNGHLRAQWYPSEQAHRLIWIAPYLKGPEDAPMLTHAYKVAQ